jgi:N-acetyl-gamma-glutamyl-phosphate reductase
MDYKPRSARIISSPPNLYGSGIHFVKPEEAQPCDIVFFSLPSGHASTLARKWLVLGTRIIDLGADFRLDDLRDWNRLYGQVHEEPELLREAVYGITELNRPAIRRTRLIANPGCYSSAAILGLAPLIRHRLVDLDKLVVDGLSGTSGMGADSDRTSHHFEIANNLIPYNVVDHRHTYEMEQELGKLIEMKVNVHFTTTYVPITRGILAICHAFPLSQVSRQQLLELYRDFYAGESFVQIFDQTEDSFASWKYAPYPWVNAVSGTNRCQIGLDLDEKRGRIVVFSVLDNLGKGGSHAGVQNMNVMFGLDESLGLSSWGLHPYCPLTTCIKPLKTLDFQGFWRFVTVGLRIMSRPALDYMIPIKKPVKTQK